MHSKNRRQITHLPQDQEVKLGFHRRQGRQASVPVHRPGADATFPSRSRRGAPARRVAPHGRSRRVPPPRLHPPRAEDFRSSPWLAVPLGRRGARVGPGTRVGAGDALPPYCRHQAHLPRVLHASGRAALQNAVPRANKFPQLDSE